MNKLKEFLGFGERRHFFKYDPRRQLTEREVKGWCKEDGHWYIQITSVNKSYQKLHPHVKPGYFYLGSRFGKKRNYFDEIRRDYRNGKYSKYPLCCILWFQIHVNLGMYLCALSWVNHLHCRLQWWKEKRMKKDWNYWACPICVLRGNIK